MALPNLCQSTSDSVVSFNQQLSTSLEGILYIGRIWDLYVLSSRYDSANTSITANMVYHAEQLLLGRNVEIDLNRQVNFRPLFFWNPTVSKVSIGLKKVAFDMKYDF